MEITKVYPLDAVFDSPEDVPDDVMFIIFFFMSTPVLHSESVVLCRLKQTKGMLDLQTGLLR